MRKKENLRAFFYPQEWIDLMNKANTKQYLTFNILINTGARFNEARNIQVQDIDFNNNRIVLRITKSRNKDKRIPRIITISTEFSKWLQKQTRKHKLKQEDYFPMLNKSAISQSLKKLAREIGKKDYQDFSAHNLRKTFETWLVALDINAMTITAHLGHNFATAMGHYISPDVFTQGEKKLIRKILGDIFRKGNY